MLWPSRLSLLPAVAGSTTGAVTDPLRVHLHDPASVEAAEDAWSIVPLILVGQL